MKNKLILAILGLTLLQFGFVCTSNSDETRYSPRAKDGEHGINGQNGENGQNGSAGQHGGHGGNGSNNEWGNGGNGGNGENGGNGSLQKAFSDNDLVLIHNDKHN